MAAASRTASERSARTDAPSDWVRVDGRYTHMQGRDHYEMIGASGFEARVFELPRRHVAGRPSFTVRFAFDVVEAGSRRGTGSKPVRAVASSERILRTIEDAKAAATAALGSIIDGVPEAPSEAT